MAALNTKWTRRCREDTCLVRVKRNKKRTKYDSFCNFLKIAGPDENRTNLYLKLHRFQILGKHSDSVTLACVLKNAFSYSLRSLERFLRFL